MSILDTLTVGRAAAFRQPAWMGLGNVFTEPVTDYSEMLRLSGLDQILISEEEISLSGGDAEFLVPSKAIVHNDIANGTRNVLGISGAERTVFQPSEAFAFLQSLEDGAAWEIAGDLKNGRVLFGALRFDRPDTTGTIPGAAIQTYLGLAVGYDGTMPLSCFVTNIRPECWNTLTAGMHGASQSFKIRQTKNARERAEVQAAMFRNANAYVSVWDAAMAEMANTPFTDKQFGNAVEHFYPKPDSENGAAALTKFEDKRDAHFAMWNASHNSEIRGTAYGAWNVLTEVQQWGRGQRDGATGEEAFFMAGAGFDGPTEKFRSDSLALVRSRAGLARV